MGRKWLFFSRQAELSEIFLAGLPHEGLEELEEALKKALQETSYTSYRWDAVRRLPTKLTFKKLFE